MIPDIFMHKLDYDPVLQKTVNGILYKVYQDYECLSRYDYTFGVIPCEKCDCCGALKESEYGVMWDIEACDAGEALDLYIKRHT